MTTKKTKDHGGNRRGAGRPTVPKKKKAVSKCIYLPADEWGKLEAEAERKGIRLQKLVQDKLRA